MEKNQARGFGSQQALAVTQDGHEKSLLKCSPCCARRKTGGGGHKRRNSKALSAVGKEDSSQKLPESHVLNPQNADLLRLRQTADDCYYIALSVEQKLPLSYKAGAPLSLLFSTYSFASLPA